MGKMVLRAQSNHTSFLTASCTFTILKTDRTICLDSLQLLRRSFLNNAEFLMLFFIIVGQGQVCEQLPQMNRSSLSHERQNDVSIFNMTVLPGVKPFIHYCSTKITPKKFTRFASTLFVRLAHDLQDQARLGRAIKCMDFTLRT